VINPDGESVSVTAPNGITPDANGIQISAARFARAQKTTLSGNRTTPSVRRRRPTMVTLGGKPVGPPAAQTTPASGAARASSAATNSSATAASTVAASSAPATDVTPQLTALQTKHDEIRKDLAELKDNHSLLAQTLTAAQTTAKQELSNQIAQMQKNHESILQKLEGFGSKLADFFEKKDSEKKDKKS
jgi:chromosome segregation ATPase